MHTQSQYQIHSFVLCHVSVILIQFQKLLNSVNQIDITGYFTNPSSSKGGTENRISLDSYKGFMYLIQLAALAQKRTKLQNTAKDEVLCFIFECYTGYIYICIPYKLLYKETKRIRNIKLNRGKRIILQEVDLKEFFNIRILLCSDPL